MLHELLLARRNSIIIGGICRQQTCGVTCERFMATANSLVDGIWPDVEHLFPSRAAHEIADLAAAADRDGQMSGRGLEVLRRIGWPGLAVPKTFGGLGASFASAWRSSVNSARPIPGSQSPAQCISPRSAPGWSIMPGRRT